MSLPPAPPDPRRTAALAALALALFVPLFALGRLGPLDFWWWMAANAALLSAVAAADPGWRAHLAHDLAHRPLPKIALGVASAALLYGLFWVGDQASRALFPFAAGDIGSVYGLKAGADPFRIGLLLGLLIGPAEEWFWRGHLQRRFADRYGPFAGFLLATAVYTAMHAASGNRMLVLAAAVCGAAWGLLYLRFRSTLLNVVSHTVWDLAVFLVFPFR